MTLQGLSKQVSGDFYEVSYMIFAIININVHGLYLYTDFRYSLPREFVHEWWTRTLMQRYLLILLFLVNWQSLINDIYKVAIGIN